MNDFQFQNTTKVYFGKNQLQHLHEEILKYGDKPPWAAKKQNVIISLCL